MARTNHTQKLTPVYHDFTQNQFGHHLIILDLPNNGEQLYVQGYTKNVLLDDYVLLKRGSFKCTYQISNLNYEKNNEYQWRAILELCSMEESH